MAHPTGHHGEEAPSEATAYTPAPDATELPSPVLPENNPMNKTVVEQTVEGLQKPAFRETVKGAPNELILKVREEISALNEDRIDDLRRRIKEGSYGVPSDTIAADIMKTLPDIK